MRVFLCVFLFVCIGQARASGVVSQPTQARVGDVAITDLSLALDVGGSQIVALPAGMQSIAVPGHGIVGVTILTPQTSEILGRQAGQTDVIYNGPGKVVRYHVSVTDPKLPLCRKR